MIIVDALILYLCWNVARCSTHCGKHPSLDHHKRRASTASRFWYYRSHLSCDKVADSVNKTGPSLEIFFSGNKIRIMVQIRACVCGKKDRCSYSQTPKHTSRYAPLVHVWFLISIIICPVSSHFGYTAWDTFLGKKIGGSGLLFTMVWILYTAKIFLRANQP